MSRFRFFPGAESWSLDELHRELDHAAAEYAARLDRGSTADSERECVLELAILVGQLLNEHAEGDDWELDVPIPYHLVDVDEVSR